MNDPISLLFGGLEKLGPGSDADTLRALNQLPRQSFGLVVDAGCGNGRQTLLLAGELRTAVHALDTHQPFLDELSQRARARGLESLVKPRCLDMARIPDEFREIDLLWCEGAVYNIGFAQALTGWKRGLSADGFLVVSELSWLKDERPEDAVAFFRQGYPAMQTVQQNTADASDAGYTVLATHIVPSEAWVDGYYDALLPRAKGLLKHADSTVREFARETVKEIAVFERSNGSYGYVFYVLQPRKSTKQ